MARGIVTAHGGTIRIVTDGTVDDAPATGDAPPSAATGTQIEIVLPVG